MCQVFNSLVFAACAICVFAGKLRVFNGFDNAEFPNYGLRGHNSAIFYNNNFYKQRSYDFAAPSLKYQKYGEKIFSGYDKKNPVRPGNKYIAPGNKYISPLLSPLLPHLNQYVPPKYIPPHSIPPPIPNNKYIPTILPDLPKPNFLRHGSPLLKPKAPEKRYIPPSNLGSKIPINTYLKPPPPNPNRYLPNKDAHYGFESNAFNENLERHNKEETFVSVLLTNIITLLHLYAFLGTSKLRI